VLDVYGPLYGASALGANNLLRYILGGVSPLYTRQMYKALGIDVRLLFLLTKMHLETIAGPTSGIKTPEALPHNL
jgi:hypothetical protein